jgi:ADP-heptose:LPS heptosyltransferase
MREGMNIAFIRNINQYGGPLACRLALLARGLLFLPRRRSPGLPDKPQEIVVIKYFGMGTLLLASPALLQLKRAFPGARITLVTLAENREICEMLPAFDRVLELSLGNPLRFMASFLRIMAATRRIRPALVADLEFFTNFSALSTLCITACNPAAVSVGFHSPLKWRNRVFDMTVSFDHGRHISKIYMKFISSVCKDVDEKQTTFEEERAALLRHSDRELFNSLAAKTGVDASRAFAVCLNINAGPLCLHRRWPLPYFKELVAGLLENGRVIVLLIGGKENQPYVEGLYRRLAPGPRLQNLCGQTTIRSLIGLLDNSDLCITNDGGPLHLAHVLGTPTVSFFGPETPCLYGPLGNGHHVFYKDLYCSPCLNIYNSKFSNCRDNICLRSITPLEVLKVIRERYLPHNQ